MLRGPPAWLLFLPLNHRRYDPDPDSQDRTLVGNSVKAAWMAGLSIGMLVVTMATKVSRTAQEPPSWAPFLLSVTIKIHLRSPAIVTKSPPEKQKRKAAFFMRVTLDFHNSGSGMLIRYKPVKKFRNQGHENVYGRGGGLTKFAGVWVNLPVLLKRETAPKKDTKEDY